MSTQEEIKKQKADEKAAEKAAKAANGKFKLKAEAIMEGRGTLVSITKRKSVWVNRGLKPIKNKIFENLEDSSLPVTESDVLKSVYDSGPQWKFMIQAPANYKAPYEEQ